MSENAFVDNLVSRLPWDDNRFVIATRRAVLYELAIDDKGNVDMGVDADIGEPIRGQGKGFQQDILIYEPSLEGNTSIVPRVIVEAKLNHVTTHDAIVYSQKAGRIKRIYPYVRFGLLMGGMSSIPRRVLRLEEHFDFMIVVDDPPTRDQLERLSSLLEAEIRTSDELADIVFRGKRITSLRKSLDTTQ